MALANWDNLICKSSISCLRLSTCTVFLSTGILFQTNLRYHAKGEVIVFVESIVENMQELIYLY